MDSGSDLAATIHGLCPIARKSPDHGYKMADDAMMTGFAKATAKEAGQIRNRAGSTPYLLTWQAEKSQ